MIVNAVTIYVKSEFVDDFIRATTDNHRNSIKEPGILRFDFLQCTDDPTRFLLYEMYKNAEAVASHKETPHYLRWRDTVADWMAKPREGIPHRMICPEQRSIW
ncbi:MAG: antibiotic biosynthesis monooxygenase [Candidatus Latescibacterota bacterium]